MNNRYSLIREDIVNSYILDNKENEIVVLCHTKRPDLGFKKLRELINKANEYEKLNNQIEMKVVCKGEKPSYTNEYAAGLDIRANNNEPITIHPGEYHSIPANLAVEIPRGHFGMIVPRSGLGFKHRITLINDVGIIDEDYRGEIGVKLVNDSNKPYTIEKGDRVAQMIIIPYIQPKLVFVDELEETERGNKGFGSTGR